MDRSRPRTSRPRRRCGPLVAKPRPPDSESDTPTETDTESLKIGRPKTACSEPVPMMRSKYPSGVQGYEEYLSAYDTTDTDSHIIKDISRKPSIVEVAPPKSSSGVRLTQGDEKYYSAYETTGTETDTETLKAFPQKQLFLAPEPAEKSSDVRSLLGDKEYSSDFESDDADTVIAVAPKQKYSAPAPLVGNSDVRFLEAEKEYGSIYDSEDPQTVSLPLKEDPFPPSTEFCRIRAEKCLKDETPRVPVLNLDDLESASVILKSAKGCTDLKYTDFRRRDSSGSRIGDQLKRIDSKNMLFFPSKNLTRPSLETIYGPVKKRSSSLLRRSSNSLTASKTTSSLNIEKTRSIKAALVEDTPRPAVKEEATDKPSSSISKKIEPKILPPLMTLNLSGKKIEKNRAAPGKPKPFTASGCGKGIPSLENLPKPKIGKLPSFIVNKKKNVEGSTSLRSRSLTVLDNTEIKPAIPQATLSCTKPTNDLFTRNRIPLRKHGSRSTTNLIARSSLNKEKLEEKKATPAVEPEEKQAIPTVKTKKSVTFLIPEKENPKPEKSAYIDDCRRQYIDLFEKPPTFEEGPLPVTDPSPIYQAIQKRGWDYTQFTPKKPNYPVPTIPYNFLDQYLHIFDNNLERAAVHTKHGLLNICSCEEAGAEFCEKHINTTKLQYYHEAAQVMIYILSIHYEVPEYEEVEKMFQEKYPYIYQGWIQQTPHRLSMDYRVREAKCKSELVKACEKVLVEEDLLAEYQQSEEILGHRRDINISGRMKDVERDFEYSYTFLFTEYPNLFIQLVQKIEFMPLATERRMVATFRKAVVAKANCPDEKLQAEEEYYKAKLKN